MGVFVTIRISLFRSPETARLVLGSVIYGLIGAAFILETKNITSRPFLLINSSWKQLIGTARLLNRRQIRTQQYLNSTMPGTLGFPGTPRAYLFITMMFEVNSHPYFHMIRFSELQKANWGSRTSVAIILRQKHWARFHVTPHWFRGNLEVGEGEERNQDTTVA